MTDARVLFEPWGLGDALIAFAIALQRPGDLAVACQSRWHPVLAANAAVQGLVCPSLLSADLSYVSRNRTNSSIRGLHPAPRTTLLLSIRGDMRDFRAAREMFPGAKILMRGWVAFAAKRSSVVDLAFAWGLLHVRNRYAAWARITGVPWAEGERFFGERQPTPNRKTVVLHAGAQWRSKQFPHVAELATELRKEAEVHIVLGPGDPLPPDVDESEVQRLHDDALVRALCVASCVVANDSGPMHVAAMLRRHTVCVTNHAAMLEWLPPGVILVAENAHKGHRATHVRPSDTIFDDWPSAQQVADAVQALI